jgi:hypothetical protein
MIVVCVGGGESLTQSDVDHCNGRADVLAINNAYLRAPWARWLYAADYGWWKYHISDVERMFTGERWAPDVDVGVMQFGVRTVECDTKGVGLCKALGKINGGNNGGFQAINLAYHFGATKILLLGYDMGGRHWHGDHPQEISGPAHSADYALYASAFPAQALDLAAAGVEVVNCSRKTTLTCFRRSTIEQEL